MTAPINELRELLDMAGYTYQQVASDLILIDQGKHLQLTRRDEDKRVLTSAGESFLSELREMAKPKALEPKRKQA